MPQHKRFRTGDQTLVRQINLAAIMNHLREQAPLSRAALAEVTGLHKTTVSSLVRELIDHQYVREVGLESASTGRPGVLLELNPDAGCIVSCEIGVDFLSVICTDFAVQEICRHREEIPAGTSQAAVLDRLQSILRQIADASRGSHRPWLGLAVGVPGLVERESGTLLFAPNLGWRDIPLRATLQGAFGVPVYVDNEANMGALGEYYFGAAQGHDEVLYISAGVGLGGGVVHGGRLFAGVTGFAGEFGHMTMDPDGEPCGCGNRGCWETQVSQAALFRLLRQACVGGRPSILVDATNGDLDHLTVPMIVDAARQGDAVALEVLDRVGHPLGVGIASLVNALNPDLVVFGGSISLASEFLLPIVHDELSRRALQWIRRATQVVVAQNGVDACVMGGVATVYQAILAEPAQVVRSRN